MVDNWTVYGSVVDWSISISSKISSRCNCEDSGEGNQKDLHINIHKKNPNKSDELQCKNYFSQRYFDDILSLVGKYRKF